MRTKNRIEIRGFVGRDPEAGTTSAGAPFTRFSLATTDRWKGKDDKQQERTEWHRVVFFGPRAEQLAEFLHKGSFVEIEGSNRTRSYEKDGQTHYITEVRGSDYALLDRRPGTDDAPPSGGEPAPAGGPSDDDIPL